MPTVVHRVTGMTCASCAARVETALIAVPGVSAARVDLARALVRIEHAGASAPALRSAVAAHGYALLDGDAPADRGPGLLPVIVAWLCALPLIAPMLGVPLQLPWPVQLALALVACVAGAAIFTKAAALARHGHTAMETLVALGALAALVLGTAQALHGEAHPAYEAAAALIAAVLLGRWVEHRARHRATADLDDLLALAPAQARLVEGDFERVVPAAQLRQGDIVRVGPGMAVPADGVVVAGAADVDEALLTGEPLPVARRVKDPVRTGAIVHGGSLDIAVWASGDGTWLARLAAGVAQAQAAQAPAQRLADRVAAWFVPAVIAIAALTAAAWWIITGDPSRAWSPALTALVVACPCALGLATPIALAVALGRAASGGLLVRDGAALDALGRATDLVLDKTGTITAGKPRLTEVRCADGVDETWARRAAAALSRDSAHPLAIALRAGVERPPRALEFSSLPGSGVGGVVEGRRLRLGRVDFIESQEAQRHRDLAEAHPMPPLRTLRVSASPVTSTGASIVALGEDGQVLALFALEDALRSETPQVLAAFAARGLRLHLCSGDRAEAVTATAHGLPFASVVGGADPAAKAAFVRRLQAEGRIVAFAGDGVNDAAALATADAGISLPGLDAASAAAGLNLRHHGLLPLLHAHDLARRLRTVIRQNLVWAFAWNLLLVPIACLGVFANVGGPALAGAAMGVSSLAVVLNALRLRR